MKQLIIDRIPSILTMICTIFAYIIPVGVYKINKKIHENYDPPWKQSGGSNQ